MASSPTCDTCATDKGYMRECNHCWASFCYFCLADHQHNDIKVEMISAIDAIDAILKKFLYHAHSQVDWTDHLTADRRELKRHIKNIESTSTNLTVLGLPDYDWMKHVTYLILKDSSEIYRKCLK